jgi:adenylate cyclase
MIRRSAGAIASGWRYLPSGRRSVELLALVLVAGLLALRIVDPVPLVVLRQQVLDGFQRLSPRREQAFPAVVVDIDDRALQVHGQWPWPRDLVARLLERILAGAPRVVAFDMLFAEPDRLSWAAIADRLAEHAPEVGAQLRRLPGTDRTLADAMRGRPVVLAQVPLLEALPGAAGPGSAGAALAELGGSARPYLPAFPAVLANLPELEAAAAGHGSIGLPAELDNVVRRIPLLVRADERVVPALAVEMLRVAAGETTILVHVDAAGIAAVTVGRRRIATDRNGIKAVHFAPPDPRRRIGAAELLGDPAAAARLRDRLVIVGSSAAGLLDIKATPISAAMPGSEVHAQLLEAILAGADVTRPATALGLELALGLATCLLVLALVPRLGAVATLGLGALVAALLVGGALYLFVERRLLIDTSFPALAGLIVYGFLVFAKYAREEAGRKAVRNAFGRYLSSDMVDRLVADPSALRLGGELREATVMFVDVRDFTAITERLGPERLTVLVNRVLTAIGDAIQARGGTIDKFIGDAVMAFWNAPLLDPDHRRSACVAALDVLAAVAQLDAELQAEGRDGREPWPRVRVGIGLNTGQCHIGNMGSQQRFSYSALGRPVNVAARLETLTKEQGFPILAGEETARGAPELAWLELDPVVTRGSREATGLRALIGDAAVATSPAFATLREAHAAVRAARATGSDPRLSDALAAAEAALAGLPGRPLVRTVAGATGGTVRDAVP